MFIGQYITFFKYGNIDISLIINRNLSTQAYREKIANNQDLSKEQAQP